MRTRRPKLAFTTLLACCITACKGTWLGTDGGLHKAEERTACVRAFYSEPITGHALAWHGVGDVPNEGFSLQNYWFLEDRVALGVGLTGVQFHTPGDRILGGEIEGRLRYYFAETGKLGFFGDFTLGYLRTQSEMPPDGGLRNNGTFAFGPGLEYGVGENRAVQLGFEFHHFSNGHGRDKDNNPSQNELKMWLGFALTW